MVITEEMAACFKENMTSDMLAMRYGGDEFVAFMKTKNEDLVKKNIGSTNYNRKVLAIYNYYIRLLKFDNLVNSDQLPYLKFAKLVAKENMVITAEQHINTMNIFLKHKFSNKPLSQDEIKYIENTVFEYRTNKLKSISGEEKFEFIFVENLG